jgi:hypothetical protein
MPERDDVGAELGINDALPGRARTRRVERRRHVTTLPRAAGGWSRSPVVHGPSPRHCGAGHRALAHDACCERRAPPIVRPADRSLGGASGDDRHGLDHTEAGADHAELTPPLTKVAELLGGRGRTPSSWRCASQVKPGGCSGYSYDMFFDTEVAEDDVSPIVRLRSSVVVDEESAALLTGSSP